MRILVFSLCPQQHTLVKSLQKFKAYPFSSAQVSISQNNLILAYSSELVPERLIYILATLIERFSIQSVILLYPSKESKAGATPHEIKQDPCITLANALTGGEKPLYLDLPAAQLFPLGMQEDMCSHPLCPALCRALLVRFSHAEIIFAHCNQDTRLKQCFQFLLNYIAKKDPLPHFEILSQCAKKFHCTQTELSQIDSLLQTMLIYKDEYFLNIVQNMLSGTAAPKNMQEKSEFITVLQKRVQEYHASC